MKCLGDTNWINNLFNLKDWCCDKKKNLKENSIDILSRYFCFISIHGWIDKKNGKDTGQRWNFNFLEQS